MKLEESTSKSKRLLTLPERRAFGKLYPLVKQAGVRDILAHTEQQKVSLFIDDGETLKPANDIELSVEELREISTELISVGGRHVDELEPCADVRLGNGIRVHVVLPPAVRHGPTLAVRLPQSSRRSLMSLFRSGLCDTTTAKFLLKAVFERRNVLITGATGSGKTTLLAALLSEAKPNERIITIEDVAEIVLKHPHHIALEARQANSEGIGEVSLERLLRESLRMRPDRLVLGECRGAEVVTLLTALNTGHDGGISTLHANGVNDVPARLEALGALAGLEPSVLARQAVSAIDLVVHVARHGSKHRVSEIARLEINESGNLVARVFNLEESAFKGYSKYQGIFEVA